MSGSSKPQRSLQGPVIGISISNAGDLAEWGYTGADVNRATVRLSEALLAAGARLVFGHDWKPDGIMDAICRLAIRYQTSGDVDPAAPLIQSWLAWPDQSQMEPDLQKQLEQRGILKIETLNGPAETPQQSRDRRVPRAIALVELRKELVRRCDARICLGGKDGRATELAGFYPGVIEEACRSELAGQPIYIGSFLGGVCARVADLLRYRPEDGDSPVNPAIREVFRVVPDKEELIGEVRCEIESGTESPEVQSVTVEDLPDSLESKSDVQTLQTRSGLSPEDWRELLDAPDTESFVTWVIRGLRQNADQLRRIQQLSIDGTNQDVDTSEPTKDIPTARRTRRRKATKSKRTASRKAKRPENGDRRPDPGWLKRQTAGRQRRS